MSSVATDPSRTSFVASLARVQTSTALAPVSRFEPIPELKAPTASTATAVVVAPQPAKRGFMSSWFESKPAPPADPAQADANRAWSLANALPNQVRALSGMLGNGAQLLTAAPNKWEELLTPYIVARAATVAVMASIKTQLDEALDAGVRAALEMPSRSLYQQTAAKIRAADAEFEALLPTATARHGEALDAKENAARAAEQVKAAERSLRESVRDLDPKIRAGLIAHIQALGEGGYHFARAAHNDPSASGIDTSLIPAAGVIPTLALHGLVIFGKKHPHPSCSFVPHGDQRPVNSLAELIELAESLMGRIARE